MLRLTLMSRASPPIYACIAPELPREYHMVSGRCLVLQLDDRTKSGAAQVIWQTSLHCLKPRHFNKQINISYHAVAYSGRVMLWSRVLWCLFWKAAQRYLLYVTWKFNMRNKLFWDFAERIFQELRDEITPSGRNCRGMQADIAWHIRTLPIEESLGKVFIDMEKKCTRWTKRCIV